MSLEIVNVNKHFGENHVIKDLSLQVNQGAVYGFLGPNGSGKTTTMRMILDIIKPDSGTLSWQGKKVSLDYSRQFGYLPEERGLYPKMHVLDQMKFFARIKGLPPAKADQEINYWVERFQLEELVKKKANELSKGNQQKVQFILAILNRPELMILDEPFSGLDPVNVELLKQAFVDFAREGKTILFSSHRMEHVEELCDALCLIKKGEVIAQGSVEKVRRLTGRKIIRLAVAGSLGFLADWKIEPAVVEAMNEEGQTRVQKTEFDLPQGVDPQAILQDAFKAGHVYQFEIADPSLNEVFISLVGGNGQ